jgi:hypothetical protein
MELRQRSGTKKDPVVDHHFGQKKAVVLRPYLFFPTLWLDPHTNWVYDHKA